VKEASEDAKNRNFFESYDKVNKPDKPIVKKVDSKTDSGYCTIPRTVASVSLVTKNEIKSKDQNIKIEDKPVSNINTKDKSVSQANLDYEINEDIEDALIKGLNNNMMIESEMTAHFAACSLAPDSEIQAVFEKQEDYPQKIKPESLVRKSRLGNVGWDVNRLTDEDGYYNMEDWMKLQNATQPKVLKRKKKARPTLNELVNRQRHADRMRQTQVQSRTQHATHCNELFQRAKSNREQWIENIQRNIDIKQHRKNENVNIQRQAQNERVHRQDQQMALAKERRRQLALDDARADNQVLNK